MSIDDDLGKGGSSSITNIERALELFTDRFRERRHFAAYLNDDPPRDTLLFFYGDGGNGKSWLLRMLRERYCRRLGRDSWAYVRTLEGQEFVEHYENAEDATAVPFAYLDFGDVQRDEQPRNAFHGLVILRKQLGRQGVRFPLFDYAMALYQIRGLEQPADSLKSLFPSEETGFADMLVNLVQESKRLGQISTVFSLLNKHLGKHFMTLYLKRRKVTDDAWAALERLDPRAELFQRFPELFAKDLNAELTMDEAPDRVVLLFDTHEAFWGAARMGESDDSYHARDEWLRHLLRALDFKSGVVTALAGRESPQWTSAPEESRIPAAYMDVQLVGHLEPEDADAYLEKAGVNDPDLRRALGLFSEVQQGQVHPLYLGLCGDIALAAERRGEALDTANFADSPAAGDKTHSLIRRLLRYCDQDLMHAVKSLAAARAFDRDLFFALGQAVHYHATEAAYRQLLRFSFVWPVPGKGEGWSRIHDLLRRALWTLDTEEMASADAALEAHYRALANLGDSSGIVSAIYHANRQDWERGVSEWQETFDQALGLSRHALCEALLELTPELWLETELARGKIALSRGEFQRVLSRHAQASVALQDAIARFGRHLEHLPDDANAHNNKGIALATLGKVQASLSEHSAAMNRYNAAIAAFNEALRRDPDKVYAQNNKGNTLQALGEVHASLGEHAAAIELYRAAIATFDETLRRAPDYFAAHNNKGIALTRLGDLQASLGEHAAAKEHYLEAISAYDEALWHAPSDIATHNNKTSMLQALGDVEASLGEHAEAMGRYRDAIAAYDEALQRAPDDVAAHYNKGNALQRLGEIQANRNEHAAAIERYREAIAAYDEALRRAPNDVAAHNNKGNALKALGDVQAGLCHHPAAMERYREAIAAFDEVLRRAPNYVDAHYNKGNTLKALCDVQASLGEHTSVLEGYSDAIADYDEALRLSPDHINAHYSKGISLAKIADVQANLGEHATAIERYLEAIAAFDEALRRAPDGINTRNSKGIALAKLGDVQASLGEHTVAMKRYHDAIAAYDETLRRAPDDVCAHHNKGTTLRDLGNLHARLGQHAAAQESYRNAIAAYDEALRHAPDSVNGQFNKGLTLKAWGELDMNAVERYGACEKLTLAVDSLRHVLELAPDHAARDILIHVQEMRRQICDEGDQS